MNVRFPARLALTAALFVSRCLHAQNAQFSSFRPVLQSSASSASVSDASAAADVFSPAVITMVQNRARTLGNTMSGSSTRYVATSDLDIRGLTPAQTLARLSPPPVVSGDGVRKVEISINLHHPVVVEARPGQAVDIGTEVVQAAGGLKDVEVHASIFLDGVTVLNK